VPREPYRAMGPTLHVPNQFLLKGPPRGARAAQGSDGGLGDPRSDRRLELRLVERANYVVTMALPLIGLGPSMSQLGLPVAHADGPDARPSAGWP